ncbi:MAG: hypothetical protein ACLFQK_02015 [Fibrobacterota bacterium]
MRICCYITGHGFGHASRTLEVLSTIRKYEKNAFFSIRTNIPRWFIEESLPEDPNLDIFTLNTGAGLYQENSLCFDLKRTLKEGLNFLNMQDEIIEREIRYLKDENITSVISDIPAWPFAAAEECGIPSYGIGNFSWDWIYEEFMGDYNEFIFIINDLQKNYEKCNKLMRLPFSPSMDIFPERMNIPLICRRSEKTKEETLSLLGLDPSKKYVLLSFGGFSIDFSLWKEPRLPAGIEIIASERVPGKKGTINSINRGILPEKGLNYKDLVAAADTVITKPGYGIVSECIANKTKMIYTDRGPFREFPFLKKAADEYLCGIQLSNADVSSGNICNAVLESIEKNIHEYGLPLNGAEVAAGKILADI